MLNYEEYKNKVYDIFNKKCLTGVDAKEKIKYLKEQEKIIKEAYDGDVYSYKSLGMENVFTDSCIYSRICSNLEELY